MDNFFFLFLMLQTVRQLENAIEPLLVFDDIFLYMHTAQEKRYFPLFCNFRQLSNVPDETRAFDAQV